MCILFKAYVLMNIGSPINFEEKITFLLFCAFGSPNKSVNSDVPYIVTEDQKSLVDVSGYSQRLNQLPAGICKNNGNEQKWIFGEKYESEEE